MPRLARLMLLTACVVALVPMLPASAGPQDTCVLLDRVIPADVHITDDSSENGESADHCLALASPASGGQYNLVIDRLDDATASGVIPSPYLRARGSGLVDFTVPGLGETSQAWEDPELTDVVIQWGRQCFVLEVSGDYDVGTTREVATALALDIDRVLGQRDRGCPGGSSTATSSTTTTTLAGGRALCAEARTLAEGFSPTDLATAGITDPLHTSIIRDDTVLFPDLRKAIADWDSFAPDARSYAKDGFEAVTNILWVTGAKDLLPVNGTRAFRRSFITGQEQNLVDSIRNVIQTRQGRGDARALTPGDVFALAIELHDGDVTEALLTAHNAMRGLVGETDVGVSDGLGEEFFDVEIAPVRGTGNADALAQLFGAAYLEMSVQGSWGATGTEFFVKLLSAEPVFLEVIGDDFVYDQTKEAIQEQGRENVGSSLTSRVLNAFARYARTIQGKPFDPERFCFGVWGAQLGKELYEALPYAGTRAVTSPPFGDLNLPTDDALPALGAVLAERSQLNVLHSPFSVQWQGPSGQMLFNQGPTPGDDARLAGDAPPFFVALPDGESWGAAWLGGMAVGDLIQFEATAPGAVLHFHRIDLATGTTSYYEAVAPNSGDRFYMEVNQTTGVPVMVDATGVEVAPIVFELGSSSLVNTDPLGQSGGGSSSPVVWILVGAAVLAIGAGLYLRRRKSAVSTE